MIPARSLSILGCGWLGLPLAREAVARGLQVVGSTTRKDRVPEIRATGAEAVIVNLETDSNLDPADAFWRSDAMVLMVPPRSGRVSPPIYARQLVLAADLWLAHRNSGPLIYASSISVFGRRQGEVTEESPMNPTEAGGEACRLAETELRRLTRDLVVVRFGGLVGLDRHPGRFLAGKTALPERNAPLNLIHQADAAGILLRILELGVKGETFHAVCDERGPKDEFYREAARSLNLPEPQFTVEETAPSSRFVRNDKVKDALKFSFRYPKIRPLLATWT